MVVDSLMTSESNHTVRDFAYCSRGDDRGLFGNAGAAGAREQRGGNRGRADSGARPLDRPAEREPRGSDQAASELMAELRGAGDFDSLDMPALLNALIARGAAIEVLYVHGHWRGVNDLEDLRQRGRLRARADALSAAHDRGAAFRRSGARARISAGMPACRVPS